MALPTRPTEPESETEPNVKRAAAQELMKHIKEAAIELEGYNPVERSRGLLDLAYVFRLVSGGQQPGSVPESR